MVASGDFVAIGHENYAKQNGAGNARAVKKS
jgi:hypothetical protein